MNSKVYQIASWLSHSITAVNTHGHGIHSPRLFDIVQNVIDNPYPYYIFKDLERYREVLLGDNTPLDVTDYGTGKSCTRTVADIARKSLADKKQAQFISRLTADQQPDNILELGTSLGLTTAYMATACSRTAITTLEGCPNIAGRAQKTLDTFKCQNAKIIVGNIDKTLHDVLKGMDSIGLLYIDANHTAAALRRYFDACADMMPDNAIAVIDDIYWSEDMNRGWLELTKHRRVTASFDLYRCGLLFLDPNLPKKTFRIRL